MLVLFILLFFERQEESYTLLNLAEKNDIYIGSAASSYYLDKDENYNNILKNEFNIITTENEMKFDVIHPGKYRYDFTLADKLINFGIKNNQKVRGHTLVWHRRIPEWLENGNYSKEEMKQILKEHIQTVVGKYKGKIYAWDVVNEAFEQDGTLRDSIWLKTIGPEYIELSFKWAHEADPTALLFYNDYNIEGINKKSNSILKMIEEFHKKEVPINGIGIQMHTNTSVKHNFEEIIQNMNRYSKNDIQVQLTEVDVSIDSQFSSKYTEEVQQADIYSNSIKACIKADLCTAFIIWGVTDKYSPRKEETPLIFDTNYQSKKAYIELKSALSDRE